MYYRLLQLDQDGNSTITEVISAECTDEMAPPRLTIAPNPARSTLTLMHAGGSIAIYSTAGQLVGQYDAGGDTTLTIDLNHLPQGTYLVRSQSPSGHTDQRILVKL